MKYQLIIQFPEEKYGNIDRIADMEDLLDECLMDAEVDGHDIGGGKVNIFIHANDVVKTFDTVKKVLEKNSILNDVKIAYRSLNGETYQCLWPKDLTEFKVL